MTDKRESINARARAGGAAPGTGTGADEFAHIRTPRARHPVLAGAAALLAFYLVFHVRAELRYALATGDPLDLGEARVTFSPRTTVTGLDNRLVRVAGTPDRESGLEVDTKGSWTFSQFFRVLGTGNRLFIHRRESPLPGAQAEADVFEGRLVRFRELPFEDAVRAYFSAHVVASHFFSPDDLRGALTGTHGALSLRDRAGDPVTLAPDDVLALDVSRADELRIGLPRARFVDAAAARAELERRGATIVAGKGLVKVDAPDAPTSAAFATPPPVVERWTFIARFDASKRDAALDALGDLDRRVEVRDARETLKVRVADLQFVEHASPGGVLVGSESGFVAKLGAGAPRFVPFSSVAAVRTLSTVQVPEDAYLLVESDRPREHLPTLLLALAIATFGVVNLAALARELRRREPAR